MESVTIQIDGKKLAAVPGRTVLEVARENAIPIPTLCHGEKLAGYGACRLCLVEVRVRGRSRLVASCVYPVAEGLQVETGSERVRRVRRLLLELLLATTPGVLQIRELAHQYGIGSTRFLGRPDHCILCGLCVRYCEEVKGAHAVGFVGRGTTRRVTWVPDSKYFFACQKCLECVPLCPTGVFPSNFGIERVEQLSDL